MPTPDPAIRAQLAERTLADLKRAVPGSTARLRGSLSEGTADHYSDIDVLWIVPDRAFPVPPDAIARILAQVRPVESLRVDPTTRSSRRLIFARFEGVPLFWRLDLEVRSTSRLSTEEDDAGNQDGPYWSRAESGLMNAVAAVKAHLRDDDTRAREVLQPGYERVGLELCDAPLENQILGLVEGIRKIDPATDDLARRVENLVVGMFKG